MKTVNKYGIEFAGQPRARRGWKRRLGGWLWSLVWMVLVSLALWGLFAWATGRVTGLTGVTSLTMARPASAMRLAGFGVPEWVAYGITGTLVLGILARLAWGAMQEAFQIGELSEPPEHDGLEVEANAAPMVEPWMEELRAMMRRRNSVITDKQCRQIRALCVPRHRMDLVMLDAFLRRELGLRLFVTTLKEVQAICAKGDVTGVTSLTNGEEGVVL